MLNVERMVVWTSGGTQSGSEAALKKPTGEQHFLMTFLKWGENCQNWAIFRAVRMKTEDGDRFTCNRGHCWHDIKWPGQMSALLNMSDVTQQKASVNELEVIWFWAGWSLKQQKNPFETSLHFFLPFSFLLLSYKKTSYTQTAGEISPLTGMAVSHRVTHFESEVDFSSHYQNCNEEPGIPSTQDGAALVVPATCPGKQEHLTVWDLSSILFLLQHRWAAITSQVPAFTWTGSKKYRQWFWKNVTAFSNSLLKVFQHCDITVTMNNNSWTLCFVFHGLLLVLYRCMSGFFCLFLCVVKYFTIKVKKQTMSPSCCPTII